MNVLEMLRPRRSVSGEVRWLLRIVVAIAVVLLVANVVPRVYILGRLAPQVAHLRAAASSLDQLHTGMVDEETGIRGYLATGSKVFLQPYDDAVASVSKAGQDLSRDAASAGLGGRLVELEVARERWADEWASMALNPADARRIGLAGSGAPNREARLTRFMLTGKQLFDDYRASHDSLNAAIEGAITGATATEHAWLIWSGGLQAVIALSVIGSALLIRRRMTRRITAPIENLARGVTRVADGDLSAAVAIEQGPAELVALGRDVDRMADALRDQIDIANERQQQATLRGQRLATVLQAAREVAGSLNLRYVLTSIADAALKLDIDRVRVWLLDEEPQSLDLALDTANDPKRPSRRITVQVGTGVAGRAVRYGRPVGPEPLDGAQGAAVACPLIVGGRVVGALECMTTENNEIPTDVVEIIEALAGHAAAAVDAAQLHERTRESAVTDVLTRLPNRRAFDEEFTVEVERACRYGRPLSVISVDLDHFKRINDEYGHAYGDLALQQASHALRNGLRATDRIYRLGGEEIAILCPETPSGDAAILADRLRESVASAAGPDAPPVTASFGVAELPLHAADGKALLAAADRALYAAKDQGRNRVVVDAMPRLASVRNPAATVQL